MKPRGGENFCNSSSLGTLAASDWLPAERQLFKISFGSRETLDALVAAEVLRAVPDSQRQAVMSCAYNVPGRVEEYFIAIPSGQGPGSNEVRTILLAALQKLFNIKPN